jgi:hypothetical protein
MGCSVSSNPQITGRATANPRRAPAEIGLRKPKNRWRSADRKRMSALAFMATLPPKSRLSILPMRLGSTALATERVERRLAAILAADVAGYSRLMGADAPGTLQASRAGAPRCLAKDKVPAADTAQPPKHGGSHRPLDRRAHASRGVADGRKTMAGRVGYGLIPGSEFCWLLGQHSVRGCRPLRARERRGGIVQPIPWYGSTHQARAITLRTILGTVTRNAVLTFAKLKPTKMACAHGQIHDEGKKGFQRLHRLRCVCNIMPEVSAISDRLGILRSLAVTAISRSAANAVAIAARRCAAATSTAGYSQSGQWMQTAYAADTSGYG